MNGHAAALAAIQELDVTLCSAGGLMWDAATRLEYYETDSDMAAELRHAALSCATALSRAAVIAATPLPEPARRKLRRQARRCAA